jgi:nucleotide-binding universal stress UspA family protein
MKTIIVATDYSKAATNALNYGAEVARQTGARIILFNATSIPAPITYTSYLPALKPSLEEHIAANKTRLTEIASTTKTTYGVEVEAVAGSSNLFDELSSLVKQYQADVVVMGMRGQSLKRDLLGSNTISAIKKATFPILVVPIDATYKGVNKILYACDFNAQALLNRLTVLKEWATTFDAKIEILHVEKEAVIALRGATKEYSAQQEMEEMFKGIEHSYRFMKGYDVVSGIEKEASDFKADLLVMMPDRVNYWDQVLNKSNTQKVVLKTHIPLLALPNPDF